MNILSKDQAIVPAKTVVTAPASSTFRRTKHMTMLLLSIAVGISVTANAFAADTTPSTDAQKFSYAIGFQMGQNLKQNGVNDIDVGALSQAISDVISGGKIKLSPQDMQAAMSKFQEKMMAERNAAGESAKKEGEAFLAKNKGKKGVTTTASGLQYEVMKEGNGAIPKANDTVEVHYHGTLISGKVFDSSVQRGTPVSFPVTGVIPGWQEVLQLMPVGSKWKVFIPSELAYGTRGAGADIGPNETLIFEVELLSIKS